jgi:hypothetical protein
MSATNPDVMTASLRVEKQDWGTRLDWNCKYRGPRSYGDSPTYELVITDSSGRETVAATWVAANPEAASLTTISAVRSLLGCQRTSRTQSYGSGNPV